MMNKSLLLLLFLWASCQTAPQTSEPANLQNENEKLSRQLYTHFNRHEWQQMASLYAEPASMKDPAFGTQPLPMTRAEIVKKYTELQQSIPDIHDSLLQLYHAGNHVIVEFISRGTALDKTAFLLPICTIFEIKQGKIVSDYTYYDNF